MFEGAGFPKFKDGLVIYFYRCGLRSQSQCDFAFWYSVRGYRLALRNSTLNPMVRLWENALCALFCRKEWLHNHEPGT
jgi:hypothetical protein